MENKEKQQPVIREKTMAKISEMERFQTFQLGVSTVLLTVLLISNVFFRSYVEKTISQYKTFTQENTEIIDFAEKIAEDSEKVLTTLKEQLFRYDQF